MKTFLFSDIAGSTRLWEKHPDEMRQALEEHDRLTNQTVGQHGGRVFKHTGDGFAAVFDSARSALEAAAQTQLRLSQARVPEIGVLAVRIGVHSGEAQERDGDYFGLCVTRTARLMAAGHPGQILVSLVTERLADTEDLPLKDLGEHRLRDLSTAERVFQLDYEGAPEGLPPLRTIDAAPNNLPTLTTSFVGRHQELAEISKQVNGARLVTITGVGGAGKTRIALQVAADMVSEFTDGVWLVELAGITDPGSIEAAVVSALGVEQGSGIDPLDALIEHLRDRNTLVIVDNCEHLIDAVADLVNRLLAEAPDLRVIGTSRELLGVPGEVSYRLRSMSVPSDDAKPKAIRTSDAVQLFLERGAAARTEFRLTSENAEDVAEICRRLDGIPLAIELAAARLRTFSASAIASHLDERFRLLTGGSRTALPRQQTLTATIEWSYRMLEELEAELFRRLSVFQEGFTFDSATAVCVGDPIEPLDVLELLPSLVDKSLISVDDHEGETRYRLLETLRQFARDRLDEQGHSQTWRRSHAEHFATLIEGLDIGTVAGPKGPELLRRLRHDLGNLRQAMEWAFSNDRIDLALPLLKAFQRISSATGAGWSEGLAWTRRLFEADHTDLTDEEGADIAYLHGGALLMAGELEKAIEVLSDSVRVFRALDARGTDPSRTKNFPLALNNLSLAKLWKGEAGDHNEVYTQYQNEILELARNRDDRFMIAMALANLAHHRDPGGDPTEARRLFDQAEQAAHDIGSESRLAGLAIQRAGFEFYQGELDEARHQAGESERIYDSLGHDGPARASRAFKLLCEIELGDLSKIDEYRTALRGQLDDEARDSLILHQTLLAFGAGIDLALGRHERVALAEGASKVIQEAGQTMRWDVVDYFAKVRERARSELGDAAYEELSISGSAMTPDEITSFLLEL